MSPSPAAPSRASVIAWRTTSASLWPARPRAVRNGDPAEHDRALAGEGMDVEAHAGARDEARRRAIARRAPSRPAWSASRAPDRRRPRRRSCPAARSDAWFRRSERRPTSRIGLPQARRGGMPAGSGPGPGRTGRPARRAVRRRGPACRRPAGPAPRLVEFELGEQPVDHGGGQKGRAASWTRTASPSIAARPARTESARSAPPSIEAADVAARRARSPASCSWPGADDHPHVLDRRMVQERLDRPAQHRLAAERAILLGQSRRPGGRPCRRRRSGR